MENPVKMEFSKFYCTIISQILLSDLTGLMRLGLVVSPVFGAGELKSILHPLNVALHLELLLTGK